MKRSHEAIETLRKAILLKPQHPEWAWGLLGDIYTGLNIQPEAIAAYREALQITPNDTNLKGRYGIVLREHLQYAEALQLFETIRDEHPDDPFAWRQIAYVYTGMAQTEAAIINYEKSLSLDGKQPSVWLSLMYAYHIVERREDVKRAYQNLLGLDTAMAERGYRALILPYGVAP